MQDEKPMEEGPEEPKTDKAEGDAQFPQKKKCCTGCSCEKCHPPGGCKEYIFSIWDGM
jgi:hypothetical protein